MTKIKMCGLMRLEDVQAANEVRPDYIGFIFVKGRRRYISPDVATELKSALDPDIKAVGVFINEDISLITKLVKNGIVDAVQLHGDEDEEYIQSLRKSLEEVSEKDKRCAIIKAFQLPGDAPELIRDCSADYVLLDSGTGSGKTFDWSSIGSISRDYFLAGGIDADNITEAVRTLRPYGIDVSSGIETDGMKDPAKMRRLKEILKTVC